MFRNIFIRVNSIKKFQILLLKTPPIWSRIYHTSENFFSNKIPKTLESSYQQNLFIIELLFHNKSLDGIVYSRKVVIFLNSDISKYLNVEIKMCSQTLYLYHNESHTKIEIIRSCLFITIYIYIWNSSDKTLNHTYLRLNC